MTTKMFTREKLWPFLTGVGSALVMILAFFIPSLQDQYDRYQSRKIIDQYEMLGNAFYQEEKFDMAEQAYQKAFEFSDNKRLDLEMKRLEAKINRVNMDPKWAADPPEDLEEIDFQYVLHLQEGKEREKERLATLNSYGLFLVSSKKPGKAETVFLEAIRLDSSDALAYINLGNLYDQLGEKNAAMKNYLAALSRDKDNSRAHYNLGLLYLEKNRLVDAYHEFGEALKADSADADARLQFDQVGEQMETSK
jgi:tetratricopeptide (TPR) repeat protein